VTDRQESHFGVLFSLTLGLDRPTIVKNLPLGHRQTQRGRNVVHGNACKSISPAKGVRKKAVKKEGKGNVFKGRPSLSGGERDQRGEVTRNQKKKNEKGDAEPKKGQGNAGYVPPRPSYSGKLERNQVE